MQRIRKAVIPAAGLGTRFLPVTKAVPKELLPIVDIPTLQYIIEEAAASGIEEVLLVVSDQKDAIKAHFADAPDLEAFLRAHGKDALCERIASIPSIVKISYIIQEEPLGLGHAVSLAKDFANGEAIAVLLGDDVVDAEVPCLKQLIDIYSNSGASVLGVQQVAREAIHKYGIVAPNTFDNQGNCTVKSLVEKPHADEAPSNLAIMGRYIITPAIFDILENTAPGKGGEIQLTDALNTLAAQETMIACDFKGTRFDVGDQLGFIKANIEYGLKRDTIAPALKEYLKALVKSFN
ncbi:MAG: UTP--glucose-1-phosphate uridylyltransferase GalU [Peptococcaceae bacterium]|jgi:UTP--glucose-1-phosphate uridylyltransferase|nr:UTP--glucose-1-phosphate uridylyltransferase GalU [Peptococcaceae bacterium]